MLQPPARSAAQRARLGAGVACVVTTSLVLLAVVSWLVLPAAHLGGALGGCCAVPASAHDEGPHHHRCPGHAHGGGPHAPHEQEHDEPAHEPGSCPLCQLGLLTPWGPVALGGPLPTPEQVHALARPEPHSVPRSSPALTDAPPRGPPPPAAV